MVPEIYKGAAANDKTGTPARQAADIINGNFDYLNNKITRKDGIVVSTGLVLAGQDITVNANWQWIIDTVDYSNPYDVVLNFPLATTGKSRLDIIALTTSNTAIRIAGVESTSNPVSTALPENMIQSSLVLVTDSVVDTPSMPILGDAFVKKQESQDFIANYGATTVINQINLIDDRSSISLIGSATDVKSVQLSGEFIRPGKPHFFKNRTGHDVKLWHLAGTGNIKYFFPNGLDLIVKPNEVIQFNTNANDSGNVRFEYVGGATAVTGAMTYKGSVANYAALPSTALVIGDVYNLTNTGHNYVWSGSDWDDLGPAVDVSGKEDSSNKSQDIETDKTSTSKYASVKQLYDWAVAKFVQITNIKTVNEISLIGTGNIVTPDMDTTTAQDVLGVKTFRDGKFALRNVANTFSILFTNAVTATRTVTFPNKSGTVAFIDDIGTNFFNLFPLHYVYQDIGASIQTIGTNVIVKVGTLSWAPVNGNTVDRSGFRSSSSAGQLVSVRETSFGRIANNFGYYFEQRIGNYDVSTISDAICFYGLANTQTFIATGNPSSYNGSLIGIGSDASDTNMQLMYKDNAGSTTKINLGSNFLKTEIADDYVIKLWRMKSSNITNYEITKVTNYLAPITVSGSITHNPPTGALTISNFRANNASAIVCGLAFQRASIYVSDTI